MKIFTIVFVPGISLIRILQQVQPEDFVIATGEQHSVCEFVDIAAQTLGMKIQWKGKGINEKGYSPTPHCPSRPCIFPAHRGGLPFGQPGQSQRKTGLDPPDYVPGPGHGNGHPRPGPRPPRQTLRRRRLSRPPLQRITHLKLKTPNNDNKAGLTPFAPFD
jgi:hypothetical protein